MAGTWGRALGSGGNPNQHYDQGIRLFDEGQYIPAIAAFRDALEEPTRSPLMERLARFYIAEAHSALALSPPTGTDSGPCDDQTLGNLQAAVEHSPNYADLQYHLGSAHLSRGEYAEAAPRLRRALEINPAYAKAMLALAIALYAQGNGEEGLQFAREALALDPAFRRTAYHEASLFHDRGDPTAALHALKRMADSEGGDDTMYHSRLALDLFRREMYEEAADEYRQALALHPGYADLRNRLGVTLYALHRDTEAIPEFVQALKINPRYVDAHLNLGLACARLGHRDEARTALRSALEYDPENAAAREALSALEETPVGL